MHPHSCLQCALVVFRVALVQTEHRRAQFLQVRLQKAQYQDVIVVIHTTTNTSDIDMCWIICVGGCLSSNIR